MTFTSIKPSAPLTNRWLASSKLLSLFLIGSAAIGKSYCQSPEPSGDVIMQAEVAKSNPLPAYMVYRHFLNWVNELDKTAASSATSDPYRFAQPFTRANLQAQHLDVLRAAARRLDADLQQHQNRVRQVVTRYRAEARAALAQGKDRPPAPPEIHDLGLQETALLIHHYVSLRASLGPDASAQLDRYLAYEFAPHIKLKGLRVPAQVAR